MAGAKSTSGYIYGLYKRERVLAIAHSKEGRDAKRRWDEALRGNTPDPGWTTRLGDMGRVLGITAVAVGKLLERLGYRSDIRPDGYVAWVRALTQVGLPDALTSFQDRPFRSA
jgi:hypothetical protein